MSRPKLNYVETSSQNLLPSDIVQYSPSFSAEIARDRTRLSCICGSQLLCYKIIDNTYYMPCRLIIIILRTLKIMSRYSGNDYAVPSLSLASSRSKRAIPTKDTNAQQDLSKNEGKSKNDILDRIGRPPIFNSRAKKTEIERFSQNQERDKFSQNVHSQSRTESVSTNLNRNVYLQREDEGIQIQPTTFRPRRQQQSPYTNFRTEKSIPDSRAPISHSSSSSLLRNPESSRMVQEQVSQEIQFKKLDVNKSLFDRKIQKLFQQADFYDKELNELYCEEGKEEMQASIKELEELKKSAFNFEIGRSLIGIM